MLARNDITEVNAPEVSNSSPSGQKEKKRLV